MNPLNHPRSPERIDTNESSPLATELEFTRVYRENRGAHPALRELRCLAVYWSHLITKPRAGDVFLGRVSYPAVGFSPQPKGFGYYCQRGEVLEVARRTEAPPEWHARVADMLRFWETETTSFKTRAAYPDWVAEALPTDDLGKVRPGFPLYRLAGTQLDYPRLLARGLPGMREDVENASIQDPDLKTGLAGVLDLMAGLVPKWAACVRHAPMEISDEIAGGMEESLAFIPHRAPETFREACQLFWLTSVLSGSWNYGRLDVALGPFLARDLASGRITEEKAIQWTESLYRLMDRAQKWDHRLALGGLGRPDEKSADRFARVALEATRRHRDVVPQVTLRFHPGQDPGLMEQAMVCLAEGTTFPMLYNDAVNIPSVMKAMGVDEGTARDYLPFGCGEYMLFRKSIATPSGALNLAKCLELALNNGRCPMKGEPMGPTTGDPGTWAGFEQAFDAYRLQVETQVKALAMQQKIEYEVVGRAAPFLMFTLLHDDCLARGKAVLDGGLSHLSGTLETYGNHDAADALTAIKAIFEGKVPFTLEEVRAAMACDWKGFEGMRESLLSLPKFGNDDDEADAMALRVHEQVCRFTRDQARVVGLDSYLVVIVNNSMNVNLGRHTGALPDGRREGEPLANGNNPVAGRDRSGVTAFLASLAKLPTDIHAGSVQNMKFSPAMFGEHRQRLETLLATYWALGGSQAMLTVVNRGDLEAAMAEPEKWGHLMVRVGGFSARFVELPPDVQAHILARTLNE